MTCRKGRGDSEEMPNLVAQIVCVLALQFRFRHPLDWEALQNLAVVPVLLLNQP
jgi:hypothetical protein